MSAFFVERATIDAAVTLTARAGFLMSTDTAGTLGRDLWDMNAAALLARYGTDPAELAEEIAGYHWTPRNEETPALLKSLDCLLYQCNEGEVHRTELFRRMTALRDAYAAEGAAAAPAYAAAPWGMEA